MQKDMRDAFFDGLYECVRKDKNVIVITADHGAFGLSKIEKDYPDQFYNFGIAEQNMISVAAGLARCGKIVFVYSINNFISLRSLEQVNIDLCAMNLNVNLIGVGAGFTYSTDGPTHQGMQDMQAMMVLPGLKVYNVTDDVNSKSLAQIGCSVSGPKYFRIEKGLFPRQYQEGQDFNSGLEVLKESDNAYIISTGFMTKVSVEILDAVDDVGVADLYRVKPINEEKLLSVISKVKKVITIEECTQSGGIGEKIGFIIAKNRLDVDFLPISVTEQHCYYYGTREMLHREYEIDIDSIKRKIKDFL